MSLINCPECKNEISDQATACPNCGCPIEPQKVCLECGKELNSTDPICYHCGCPVDTTKDNNTIKTSTKKLLVKNKKKVIIIGIACVILLGLIIYLLLSGGPKLVFTSSVSSSIGTMEYKVTYTLKNGRIKTITGYQYAKFTNSILTESLWEVTNKNQDQYNYYEGLTYKATYGEDGAIKLNYSLDIDKAPTMFKSVQELAGVSGVTENSTVEEIIEIYEKAGFEYKKQF